MNKENIETKNEKKEIFTTSYRISKTNFLINKKCKMVKDYNFILYGVAKEVYSDGILFETTQATACIAFNSVKAIVVLKNY